MIELLHFKLLLRNSDFVSCLDYMTKNHKINLSYNRYLAKTTKKCLKVSENLY